MVLPSIQIGNNAKWATKDGKLLGYYKSLSGKYAPIEVDFSRTTTATRVNRNGLIETVPANVPRIDYTDGSAKLLIEPSRTNSLAFDLRIKNTLSQTFLGTENYGDVTLDKVTINNTGSHTLQFIPGQPAGTDIITMSQIIKDVDGNDVVGGFMVDRIANALVYALVRVNQNGVIVNDALGVGINSGSYYLGNGFYRIWVTIDTNNTLASNVRFGYTNLNQTILMGGYQLEAGSYPTSYIPTSGSAVTRNEDLCELTGAANLIGDSEGTLFVEASVFDDTENNTLRISDGTTANRVEFNFLSSSQFRLRVDVAGSVQVSISSGTTTSNQTYKIANKYANNDFATWVDGIELITDATGATFANGILTKIAFEGPSFYGNVKQLTVFPTALTDSELQQLTS